ncbi:MAG: hypothetical protein J2P46_04395 [Zavarzinella sp.]|nr:hypothetical protein [Zavarzinella sp.]
MKSLTDEYVLAAYVDGSDLDDVAQTLRAAFKEFADAETWPADQVLVVDRREPADPTTPDFLPQWDLGLNLGLDHQSRSPDWFTGVDSLVNLLRNLAASSGREFVLFLCFRSQPWRQEHLTFVGAGPVNLPWLRRAIERLI